MYELKYPYNQLTRYPRNQNQMSEKYQKESILNVKSVDEKPNFKENELGRISIMLMNSLLE
jgi:hypothetical protein